MKFPLKTLLAASTLIVSQPALADVIQVAPSSQQGTLVHGDGGGEDTGLTVKGTLGSNGPLIVNFNADTTGPTDEVRIQQGQGQADVTGIEIASTPAPNDTYNLLSGNIFLDPGYFIDYIEFGLTGLTSGTVDFFVTDNEGTVFPFLNQVLGSGDTFYAFDAIAGQSIVNVRYVADNPPGEITILKQVRINLAQGSIPEPGTWAMMLLGFGAVGYAMRRRRKEALLQIA